MSGFRKSEDPLRVQYSEGLGGVSLGVLGHAELPHRSVVLAMVACPDRYFGVNLMLDLHEHIGPLH
jgi:hypothetical protein